MGGENFFIVEFVELVVGFFFDFLGFILGLWIVDMNGGGYGFWIGNLFVV